MLGFLYEQFHRIISLFPQHILVLPPYTHGTLIISEPLIFSLTYHAHMVRTILVDNIVEVIANRSVIHKVGGMVGVVGYLLIYDGFKALKIVIIRYIFNESAKALFF